MRLLGKIITSLSHIENSNKKSFVERLFKYLVNPHLVFKRLVYEFSKSSIEHNWEQRAKKMGKNSVISYNYKKKESELLTKKQKKIIFSVLKRVYKKNLLKYDSVAKNSRGGGILVKIKY